MANNLTLVRHKKLYRRQLRSVELHNSRQMDVANADPAERDTLVILRGQGQSLSRAVSERLAKLGVRSPSAKRYVAAEAS